MSSTSKRSHGAVIGVGLLGILLGTPVAFAADTGITSRDLGVVPGKLVVVDMPFSARKARVIFSARDAAISNGRAVDVEQIRARLCVEYGDKATGGSFVIPAGTANGWRSNDSTLTRYRNRDAPNGATQTRRSWFSRAGSSE